LYFRSQSLKITHLADKGVIRWQTDREYSFERKQSNSENNQQVHRLK
jgi:hypothetical protein